MIHLTSINFYKEAGTGRAALYGGIAGAASFSGVEAYRQRTSGGPFDMAQFAGAAGIGGVAGAAAGGAASLSGRTAGFIGRRVSKTTKRARDIVNRASPAKRNRVSSKIKRNKGVLEQAKAVADRKMTLMENRGRAFSKMGSGGANVGMITGALLGAAAVAGMDGIIQNSDNPDNYDVGRGLMAAAGGGALGGLFGRAAGVSVQRDYDRFAGLSARQDASMREWDRILDTSRAQRAQSTAHYQSLINASHARSARIVNESRSVRARLNQQLIDIGQPSLY